MPDAIFEEQLKGFEPGTGHPDPNNRRDDLVFARLLVAHGLCQPNQVIECLRLQERSIKLGIEHPPRLGDLLLNHGYLSVSELAQKNLIAGPPRPEEAPTEVVHKPESVTRMSTDPANRIGKFIKTQLLGRGGMSEVWKAWDNQLSRWVALKFLVDQDSDELERFIREAQMSARLVHPNIAAIYEVGRHEDRHFLALQFVEGKTLEEEIDAALNLPTGQDPRFSPRTLVRIIRDCALAIDFAHQQGIIHRDIKPGNIMLQIMDPRNLSKEISSRLTPVGLSADLLRVYVMDFGLARQMGTRAKSSVEGLVLGTPAYMPPEQAAGESHKVDEVSDVYALGASLYHTLTGRLPHSGKNHQETLIRVIQNDPIAPRKINRDIPEDLENVILKAMDKDRAARYRSARGFAAELQRYLNGEPVSARRPSTIRRFGLRLKRQPLFIAGAVALLVILSVGGWFLYEALSAKDRQDRITKKLTDHEKRLKLRLELRPRLETAEGYLEQSERLIYAVDKPEEDVRRLVTLALAEIEDVLRREETYPIAWLFRGRAHELLSRPGLAESDYARAVRFDPKLGRAHFRLGMLFLRRYEDEQSIVNFAITGDRVRILPRPPDNAMAAGLRKRASDAFDRVAELEVTASQRLFARAFLLVLREEFSDAEDLLEQSIVLFQLNADAWEYRAYCRMVRGDFEGAVSDFGKVLDIRPRWPRAYHYRAVAQLCMGDLDKAIRDFEEALQMDRSIGLLIQSASAHRKKENHNRALELLKEAAASAPDRADVHIALGNFYYNRSDFPNARDAYTTSIQCDASLPSAWFNRSVVNLELKEYDRALADATRAIALDGENWQYYFRRGEIRIALNDERGVLEDYALALKYNAEAAPVYYRRGVLHFVRKRWKSARADLEIFVKLTPEAARAAHARQLIRDIPND